MMIEEMINRVICGNCIDEMKKLPENSIDAVVTDPPYELGFMGKEWDNTGIANNKEMWVECLRVLKPGGHLLAFSGTRTYHRMASAIEDAGFEVRDMIEWVYGSGFPKSLNIGKAVDKLQGNEREIIDSYKVPDIKGDAYGTMNDKQGGSYKNIEINKTKGTSEWEGWGTALKPSHEPICMARKPLSEKSVAENVLKWKTGGINIDESRVGIDTIIVNRHSGYNSNSLVESTKGKWKGEQEEVSGRFPANLIHDNSEEVRECFPETVSKWGTQKKNPQAKDSMWGIGETNNGNDFTGDSGNASRFFKSIIYQAKASKSERNKGCEELEEKNIDYDGRTGQNNSTHRPDGSERKENVSKNNHPTVKPLALMSYLIKMVTPKGGVVLDPFAGSGSTLVAAKQNGFQYIGIEKEPEYCEIAERRIGGVIMQDSLL